MSLSSSLTLASIVIVIPREICRIERTFQGVSAFVISICPLESLTVAKMSLNPAFKTSNSWSSPAFLFVLAPGQHVAVAHRARFQIVDRRRPFDWLTAAHVWSLHPPPALGACIDDFDRY
jgi:hypothetical protein